MTTAVILDLDGVLITTPNWRADKIHDDGYSDFDHDCVANFKYLLELLNVDTQLWLSSSRRTTKTKAEFDTIFANRGIKKPLTGFLPIPKSRIKRSEEIKAFLTSQQLDYYMILDDDSSLESLSNLQKKNWIRTKPLIGFDKAKLQEARDIIAHWKIGNTK
ncbi:MAG: HAD domain-containing protein [Bacteroidota bacterium]